METDPHRLIGALRRSHDDLAATIETLKPDDLVSPSACADWNVAQVMSHLGSGAEIALGVLEAAVAGREPPPRESFPAIWEGWNARSPEEMAAGCIEADERHVAFLESLDDDTLSSAKVSLAFLPAPVDMATAVGFRLSEHAYHTWDVKVSFEPGLPMASYATELLIDRVPLMAGRLAKPEALGGAAGSPRRLVVETSEPSRRYQLEIGESVSLTPLEEGAPAEGDTLKLPAEALLRLVFGRLGPDRTPAGVAVSGVTSIDDLRRVFPGF